MRELLVLWDLDGTLVSAPGLGDRLYREVYRTLFGRDLGPIAGKAGRTDRAIVLETLAMAGVRSPHAHVGPFLDTLARHIRSLDGSLDGIDAVRALPGAAGAISALATAVTDVRIRQSVLTGNIRPGAELKVRLAGLTEHLDLGIGAFGEDHVVRADLVTVARSAAAATRDGHSGSAGSASASYSTSSGSTSAGSGPSGSRSGPSGSRSGPSGSHSGPSGSHSGSAGSDASSTSAYSGWSTVLVGDTPLDVEAALATGARAVGVATGGFTTADLSAAGAHAVLADLTDAAAVIAAVTDLS